jgi:hypothetical protein
VCAAIARLAEAKGYTAAIEQEGIDVLVSHANKRLAIEVSVTTRPDDELHNIHRSLGKGYQRIIVAFLDRTALAKAAEHLAG